MLKTLATDRLLLVCSTVIVVVVVAAFVVLDVTGYGAQARSDASLIGAGVIALTTLTGLGGKLVHVQRSQDELTNGLLQSKIDTAADTAAIRVAAEQIAPAFKPGDGTPDRAPVVAEAGNPWEAAHGPLAMATPPLTSQT